MKICFCIGRLAFSGAENVMRYLAEELAKRGHEVSAMLLTNMPSEDEMIPNVSVENSIVDGSGVKNILRRVRLERNILKKIKPDAFIIFNCEMAFSAVPASFGLRKTSVVVCERNDPLSVPTSPKRRKIRDFLYRFADAGVYQTDVISEYFAKITPKRTVIQNPVRQANEMCPSLAQRNKVFVTVARLDDAQKNQTMMMKAFLRATKEHPEYQLHLLGEGPDRAKYEKFIADNHAEDKIILKGHVASPNDYVRSCRAFLLSSEFEGMPNALLEAMSVGLPCVSTDCGGGGAAALITDGENGFLVERGDEADFAKRITLLIENDDLARRLGAKAFEINERQSGTRIVDMWEACIKNLCNGK